MARPTSTAFGCDQRRRWTATIVVVVALAASGCSEQPTTGSTPTVPGRTTQAPPPSADPTDAEKAVALRAYTTSWDAQTKAYAQATSKGTDLTKVTSLKALLGIERDLAAMRRGQQVTLGEPSISPKVTALAPAKKVPEATVTDCVDVSGWKLVEKSSKKEVDLPPERLTRYVSLAKLQKWGDRWMVTELVAQDRKC